MRDSITNLTDIDRRSLLKYVGAGTAVGLAGCAGGNGNGAGNGNGGNGGNGNGDTPQDGNGDGGEQELFFGQVKGALEFDPIVLNDVPSAQISGQIFEGLYTYGEGVDLEPQLATGEPEIENDGQRYIVEMVDNATFHNGDPVTAEDVAYSFQAPVDEETDNAAELDMISSVETVDETTVQFDLEFPYAAFDITLGWSIVPKAVREDDKDAFNKQNPVGSGPFEFDEWQEGEYVRIVRHDDYWGDQQANLSFVEFKGVEEQTTRVTTLKNGENDIIETIPPQLYGQVEEMDDATITEEPGIGYFYLAFNCNEGPTADQQVREAVDYCFSMDQAVANYVEPSGVRQYSPIPASISDEWDFPVDEWEQIPHDKDIDQATQLFEDAGVDMDYEWRIIVPPDDMREQIGVGIGNGLQEVGFSSVEVQRLDWGAFLDQYSTGSEDDYNMYTLGWSGSPDPEAFTYYLFAQEVEGVTNGTYYRNDEVDQQIVDARQTTDREERYELYVEAITTLLEERAHLPAYNLKNSYGVKDYVSGFQAHPSSSTVPLSTSYTNVSVE